jgi:tRNA (guanosine-2'-O-)-methyltransferase
MRERTEERKERICDVLSRRQKDLSLVLNDVHDPHNVSAVLRSCDAFGVARAHLLYKNCVFPHLGKKSSASAKKWVQTVRHDSAKSLAETLRADGAQIIATACSPTAKPLYEWDLAVPTAVVLGNEHGGVDEELAPYVDGELYIPMQGMVQSLNVSVAAAIILYEAFRQRQARGFYDRPSYSEDERKALFDAWIVK